MAAPPNKKSRPRLRSFELLPMLDVDLSHGPANLILPCSEPRQAQHLGWYASEVRATNRGFKIYQHLPMVCAGSGCYWASQCETGPDFLFEGLRCPLEAMEIYRHWVGYIRELEIQPNDHVDLGMVVDLIRIELQLTRIDQQLQLQGMMTDKVGGVIQSRGEAVYEKQIHPLLTLQKNLRKDRNDLFEQLEASRREKRKARQSEGQSKADIMRIFAEARKMKMRPSVEEVFDVESSLPDDPKALPEHEEDEE